MDTQEIFYRRVMAHEGYAYEPVDLESFLEAKLQEAYQKGYREGFLKGSHTMYLETRK